MTDRRRISVLALGLVVVVIGVFVASELIPAPLGADKAQAQDPQSRRIAHEFIPDIRSAQIVLGTRGAPAGFYQNGELIEVPEQREPRRDETGVSAASNQGESALGPGFAEQADRPVFRPDTHTVFDAESLSYDAVFSPSIAPMKRWHVFDTVTLEGTTAVLTVQSDNTRRPLSLTANPGAAQGDRARFWGQLVVDFGTPGEVKLPSVAADVRLLDIRSVPETDISFQVDRRGAIYASATGQPGRVLVSYLLDAPQSYFSLPSVPAVASDSLSDFVPPLPESVTADALLFASELGLSRGDPLPAVLERLVAYFRSFRESERPPALTGNTYLDLARGLRGICRHRAYAFTLTALGLGIPTRFVHNEAHAWVEVAVPAVASDSASVAEPEISWTRIDLGGAVRNLAGGDLSGPRFHPRFRDPFPQPDRFESSEPEPEPEPEEVMDGAEEEASQAGDTELPQEEAPSNAITFAEERVGGLRGRDFVIAGTVESGGDGEIEVFATLESSRRSLGAARVENGHFELRLSVPLDMQPGAYELEPEFIPAPSL